MFAYLLLSTEFFWTSDSAYWQQFCQLCCAKLKTSWIVWRFILFTVVQSKKKFENPTLTTFSRHIYAKETYFRYDCCLLGSLFQGGLPEENDMDENRTVYSTRQRVDCEKEFPTATSTFPLSNKTIAGRLHCRSHWHQSGVKVVSVWKQCGERCAGLLKFKSRWSMEKKMDQQIVITSLRLRFKTLVILAHWHV